MGQKITYQNDDKKKFCQIKLDSGERILVSVAQSGVKIYKLLVGTIPMGTVYNADLKTAVDLFMKKEDWGKPVLLDKIVNRIINSKSTKEIKTLLG